MISKFGYTFEVGGEKGEEHEEEDENDYGIEEPFFFELKILWVVNDVTYKQIGPHFL